MRVKAVADEVADGRLVGVTLEGLDVDDEVGALYRRELASLPLVGELIGGVREALAEIGMGSGPAPGRAGRRGR